MANQLGFKVLSFEMPEKLDGVILVDNDEKSIGVDTRLTPMNIRKVIAHELGHYIREVSRNNGKEDILFAMKDRIFHDDEKSDEENEMDYYAAAILVPFKHLKGMIKGLNIKGIRSLKDAEEISSEKIDLLSAYYRVDKELIKRRIYEVCNG